MLSSEDVSALSLQLQGGAVKTLGFTFPESPAWDLKTKESGLRNGDPAKPATPSRLGHSSATKA
ncbi:MAG: hypothetical protein ACK53L_31045, partial [Pirellulaceae bacterium]